MWLRSIMSELHFAPSQPITLYGDNQASISIAKTPVGHTRAKQIDIRYHYLRELAGRAGRSRSLDSSPCLASLQSQIARSSRRPVSFLQPHYLIRSNSHLILGRSHPTLCQPTSLKPRSIELTKFETTVTPLALDAPPASRLLETASSFLTADARKLNKCYQCTLSQQKCSIDRALNRDNFDDQTLDAHLRLHRGYLKRFDVDRERRFGRLGCSLVRFGRSLHQDQAFRCACCAQQGYPLP